MFADDNKIDVEGECSNQTRPLKAIRDKCLDCSCGSRKEVEKCVIPDCPLYPFRFWAMPSTVKKRLAEGKTPTGQPRNRRGLRGHSGVDPP